MQLLSKLAKPEYWFQPTQMFRRLCRLAQPLPDRAWVSLPWHLDIEVDPRESIGRSLWDLGVLDLPASEVLWRLTGEGETALDVGANIGVMTALLARRVGPSGEVWAFEPHPDVSARLASNAEKWRVSGVPIGSIHLQTAAASDSEGDAVLSESGEFDHNQGVARIQPGSPGRGDGPGTRERTIKVQTRTLDATLGDRPVGVLKLDVEGHEAAVLRGASRTLAAGRIRDVVYEDHDGYPSDVSRCLESHGYRVFLIDRTFWGPLLRSPENSRPMVDWLPPNYLATRDPMRARSLCDPSGWHCV